MSKRFGQSGVTLMDLLIGMAMTSILSLSALQLLTANVKMTTQQTGHSSALSDAQQLYRMISEFVKQSEICSSCTPAKSLGVTYALASNPNPVGSLSQVGDNFQMDFLLPAGYKIWPNDVDPYDKPAVRLSWSNSTGEVTVVNAIDVDSLGVGTPQSLVSTASRASRVVNVDLWPLGAGGARQGSISSTPDGGFELCVTTRPPTMDRDYTNPEDSGDMVHYRTARVCGVIFPRNW